jgi:NADH-quinone oxidoreductase subunit J
MTTTLYLSVDKCVFILFGILLSTLLLIIVQTNPVYAVFSVILSALTLFSILLLIGAEFFALLILIIYTGVITVLFLFVVIMYNLREVPTYLYHILLNPLFLLLLFKGY